MRKTPLVLGLACLSFMLCSALAWAQCPEEPSDNGICDTLYVEIWPGDEIPALFPHFVRVPIYVTNDIPDPIIDSIAAFIIPLCFTSSNANANAIIDPEKNKCGSQDLVRQWHGTTRNLNHSVFRDLPSMEDPQVLNWMMDLGDLFGPEWDTRILNLANGDSFFLALVPTGISDQRFKGGSRVLVASMMFTIEDTTTICIDSCYWPPGPTGHLQFSRADGVTYVPRHNLPYCFSVSYPGVGDCNADGIVDIGDVVYLIGYLYRGGAPPPTTAVGDANCDGIVDIGDVVRLIGYLFKGEPPPSC